MSLSSMRNLVSGSDAFSYAKTMLVIISSRNRIIGYKNGVFLTIFRKPKTTFILNARAFCLYRKEAEPGPNVSSVALAEKENRALIVC